jgi:hypothetical protein
LGLLLCLLIGGVGRSVNHIHSMRLETVRHITEIRESDRRTV